MDQFGIALIMWLHGMMSVQAQGADFDSVQRIKAAQACMAAVAEADAPPADGDALAPPVGWLPSGDPTADANWLMRRAAEGALAGGGIVKVLGYDAASNRVFIVHEVPRPAPRPLRLAVPLGGW